MSFIILSSIAISHVQVNTSSEVYYYINYYITVSF